MEQIYQQHNLQTEVSAEARAHTPSMTQAHLLDCADCRSLFRASLPLPTDDTLLLGTDAEDSTCLEREERRAYLQGRCDDLTRESIELHLADCRTCRTKIRRLAARRK